MAQVAMKLGYFHQYDAKANHRICNGHSAGEWMSYQSVATIKEINGDPRTFAAVTDFYSGSKEFPKADVLYVIAEV